MRRTRVIGFAGRSSGCSSCQYRHKPIRPATRSSRRSSAELSATLRGCSTRVSSPNLVDAEGVPALMAATLFADARMVDAAAEARRRSESSRPGRHHGADVGRSQRGEGPAARRARRECQRAIGHRADAAARGGQLSGDGGSAAAAPRSQAPTSARRTGQARRRWRWPFDPPMSRSFASWSRRGSIRTRFLPGARRAGFARYDRPTTDYVMAKGLNASPDVLITTATWQPAELLTRWIESGANVNASTAAQYGRTPLLTAVTSEAEGADDAEAAARSWRRSERSAPRKASRRSTGRFTTATGRRSEVLERARRDARQRSAARGDPAACERRASAIRDSH